MRHLAIFCFVVIVLVAAKCDRDKTDQPISESPQTIQDNQMQPASEKTTAPVDKSTTSIWQLHDRQYLPDLEPRISPDSFVLWKCDFAQLSSLLEGEKVEMAIPYKESEINVVLTNSSTMSDELARKFPNIKSYKGMSSDGQITVRFDTNDEGVFIEYTHKNESNSRKYYLAPLLKSSNLYHAFYAEETNENNQRDNQFK